MTLPNLTKVAIIVAHPDDETLWAGGTILLHQSWDCFIGCLSRANDQERSANFYNAVKLLHANGAMGNLPDEPNQPPLHNHVIESAILNIMPSRQFDIIITHNPSGEYTRHIRHEEVSRAVIKLWCKGILKTNQLWTFAYEDGQKTYYPKPIMLHTLSFQLSNAIFNLKYHIISKTYGFNPSSFEACSVNGSEAFWTFQNPNKAEKWLQHGGLVFEQIKGSHI